VVAPEGRPPAKLVLAVVDGLKPAMLERAIATGRAPAFAAVAERGTTATATAAFPSVTPVCAASIATGALQDVHRIPSMNWWSRAERRYVEYGSSFQASWRFGLNRQLADTVYAMNGEHLAPEALTVFEALDDLGLRTAGTTYLMYRGRHLHEPARDSALSRIATTTLFRRPVRGPRELFYADLFASRTTGCSSLLGLPGQRDQHSGCVGAHLVEHDLFDFLLLSLPDNDGHSHRHGPDAQVASIAAADRQLERVMDAGGGPERFLDEHAVVVVADHSHALVEEQVELLEALEGWAIAGPGRARAEEAELAVCPAQRSAMLYLLAPEARASTLGPLVAAAREVDGVDLVLWREGERGVVASARGELRFAPTGRGLAVRDARGGAWRVEGELGTLGGELDGGVLRTPDYPDALARAWGALTCPTSGDVLLSAAPGREFPDWGGMAHVGGGSHGSLHRSDSEGALVFCGVAPPPARAADGAWSIVDVTPMAVAHLATAGRARPGATARH
jgi:hypothetical protein